MKNYGILVLIIAMFSCHKNDVTKPEPKPKLDDFQQFHKVILMDNASNNASIPSTYSFTNKDGYPNILYFYNGGFESTDLYWIGFKDKAIPSFKKRLKFVGHNSDNNYPLWVKGFSKTISGEVVFAGTIWNKGGDLGSFGRGVIVRANDNGVILMQKVIDLNTPDLQTLRFDNIYVMSDNSFVCMYQQQIIKLDANANVQWSFHLDGIPNLGTNQSPVVTTISCDNGGNIIVGLVDNGNYSANEYLMKIDKNGNIIWCKRYYIDRPFSNPDHILNIKYLVVDQSDNIYAFEEIGYPSNTIGGFKVNASGEPIRSFTLTGDCANFYDFSFSDDKFYILCGARDFTRCQYLEISDKYSLVKQGIALSASGLSELPGKAFPGKDTKYTDFIISAPDLSGHGAWQYVRLDSNWKYPFFDYAIPEIQISSRSYFNSYDISIDRSKQNFISPSLFVTTDENFAMEDYPIDKMTVTDYSE